MNNINVKKIIVLTAKEQQRLTKVKFSNNLLTLRNRAIVNLLLSTALSTREIATLELHDLNLGKGWLDVTGRKARRVPLVSQSREYLERWLLAREEIIGSRSVSLLFFTLRGLRQLTWYSLYKIIAASLDQAGIYRPRLAYLLLKQTAIHNILQRERTLVRVQAITGIKELNNIQRYRNVAYGLEFYSTIAY